MFERTKEKLESYRKEIEKIQLPMDQADAAIFAGVQRAKKEQRQKQTRLRRSLWSFAGAAMLLLVLATSIRVLPAFAQTLSSIPGMEGFVEMIQNDKGLAAIVENDYYQEIEANQTIQGITLSIDGVILDESGMNVYYTIRSMDDLENLTLGKTELQNEKDIPPGSISMGAGEVKGKAHSDFIAFHFNEPLSFTNLNFEFQLDVNVGGEPVQFLIPFEVPEGVKTGQKFVLDEQVEIEAQKMTIHEITIHPLRTEVIITFDPTNTKKLLHFEDLRLEDENGEVWGGMMNGRSSHGVAGERMVYYLQSNYFKQPKELYLRFNELQAIEKKEAFLLIDTEKGQLLERPQDGKLALAEADKNTIGIKLVESSNRELNAGLISSIKDANGEKVLFPSESMSFLENNGREWRIELEEKVYQNPLQLELFAYPSYIEGQVKIPLKNK